MSKIKIKISFLFLILLAAVMTAVLNGSVTLSMGELITAQYRPILLLRLMRIAVAAVAASGLAVSGVVLQAVLRNPLADPYLLGTSSGAGLGAVTALLLGISGLWVPAAAFLGAIAAMLFVFGLSWKGGSIDTQPLILTGVVVSIALSAVIVFVLSVSTSDQLQNMTWWLWGNLELYEWRTLTVMTFAAAACIAGIFFFQQDLNALCLGEEEALHLGINAASVRIILLGLAAFVTAVIVAVCGIIGFVGLLVPHMTRLITGPNHRLLIPMSCVLASAFMIFCDALARSLMPPVEIPIGVVTALTGAPVFFVLLRRNQKRGSA